jgi:hypothetical protein
MASVMERGAMTSMDRRRPGAARPSRLPTTLADLITAIQDVVGPKDDRLVVATVRHLLRAGRLTGRGTGTRRCPPQRQEKGWAHSVTGGADPRARGHAGGSPATVAEVEEGGGE